MLIKYISLLVLSVQNSALILTMRYSRTIPGPKYIPTTTVLLSEIIKTILSTAILLFTRWRARVKSQTTTSEAESGRSLFREYFNEIFDSNTIVPIMIPAILYTIQNNLQFLAASNLDSATFQVLYQGKVLTTALFAVLILRQQLTIVKWSGIFILTVGIVLVSYPSSGPTKLIRDTVVAETRLIGLLAVLSACFLSGFAGVFLEFLLKRAKDRTGPSGGSQLWTRNVQLSLVSVGIAALAAAYVDGSQILRDGFLYGYNSITWCTLLLQAFGGLIVAIVITYADNILKGFATSLSLIFSTAVSTMTGDVVLTDRFIIGVVLVLAATNIYGVSWDKKTPQRKDEDTRPLLLQDQEDQDTGSYDNAKEADMDVSRVMDEREYPLIVQEEVQVVASPRSTAQKLPAEVLPA